MDDLTLVESPVAHAHFSRDGELVSATPGFLAGGLGGVEEYLSRFDAIDGGPAGPEMIRAAAARWREPGGAVSGRTPDGGMWTLCSHPAEDGGVTLVSVRCAAAAAGSEREARDLLNDTLRGLSEGCALFDGESRLIVCNDRFREMHAGVREFIAPGVHWETLLREMARRRLAVHASGRDAAWVEHMLEYSEGDEAFDIDWTDGTTTSLTTRPTSLGGFILSEIDITARRRAEQFAHASEQMLSTILQASPANLCMSQIGDGEIIYQSPACVDLFGNADSAREQFADPLDRADFLTELLASGRADDFPAQARRGDGRTFPALFSARVIDYRGEEVMVSTVTDLTEQVAAERRIKDAGIRLRDAIEALSEGFILYDGEERVVMANQRFLELNAPYADMITPGRHTRDLLVAAVESEHFVDAEGWLRDYEEELARGEGGSHRAFEFQITDGTWVNSVRRPTREGGFVITWLDVTDQKNASDALAVANDRMRDAIDSLDDGFALYDADDRLVMWEPAVRGTECPCRRLDSAKA